jgi:hypothetical protein
MAIIINNFSIINNGENLAIDVETNVGFEISHINLWKMDDFKDYSLKINLDYKLEQINNREVFIVSASELNISKFEDILFIEIESTYIDEENNCSTCQDPALGITYNLGGYIQCLLAYFLESGIGICKDCNDNPNKNIMITINLLLDMVEHAIEVGYYAQAIQMIHQLKKLCSTKQCKNCETLECNSCNKFKQY